MLVFETLKKKKSDFLNSNTLKLEKKANSIKAGNLNLRHSYLITTVIFEKSVRHCF